MKKENLQLVWRLEGEDLVAEVFEQTSVDVLNVTDS